MDTADHCGYEVTDMGSAATGYAPTLSNGTTTVTPTDLLASSTRPAGCGYLNVFSNAFEQAKQPYWGRTNDNGDNQILLLLEHHLAHQLEKTRFI